MGKSYMLILSGKVSLDKQGNPVGKDDFGKQTEQAFANIQAIIQEEGDGINDPVRITEHVTDMSQIQQFRDARDKFVNRIHPPASTLVQVSKLFRDDVIVEIEGVAIIPKKKTI